MTRRTFLGAMGALAVAPTVRGEAAEGWRKRQQEAGGISADEFTAFREKGTRLTEEEKAAWYAKHPVLKAYDAACEKVFREAAETTVKGPKPAVWYIYNMGILVKTRETLFTVDFSHRLDAAYAKAVDFACITHNHVGHCSEPYIWALNGQKKIIVSNFDSNGGAKATHNGFGGFTLRPKTFYLGDVRIEPHLAAHSSYLLDFTMPFEITVGDYRIYHSGDLFYHYEISLNRPKPDLWISNPGAGMTIEDGVQMVRPKLAVVTHLQELGHDKGRLTAEDGLKAVADCRSQGHEAILPMWGERIV